MTNFVKNVLTELKTNETLKTQPLVKILTQSIEKSIVLGESEASVYHNLKTGLAAVNEQVKDASLSAILEQFSKNEVTTDSKYAALAKEVNLAARIGAVKATKAYSDPTVKSIVESFEKAIASGAPDFLGCSDFIRVFEKYSYDPEVKAEITKVNDYLVENEAKIHMLHAINYFESLRTPLYTGLISDLKEMLVNENYTADILKLKYGTMVPALTPLIQSLRVVESKSTGAFTLGEGTVETKISNLIAPAVKTEDGVIVYADNRFLSIREAKGLTGNEIKVHLDENYKIADFNPEYVKSTHPDFYALCEAFATLGFSKTSDQLGVESTAIRSFKLAFKMNESHELDVYINDNKVESLDKVNVSESLVFENTGIKERVSRLIEKSSEICNFEFIKEATNDRLLKDAIVLNLNDAYFVCEKLNTADRKWFGVDEYQLYEFFARNFGYDISSVFKTKIEETVAEVQKIEETKKNILANIEKLETSVAKLNETCTSKGLDPSEVSELEAIKEDIERKIHELKQSYIAIDLYKKKELA